MSALILAMVYYALGTLGTLLTLGKVSTSTNKETIRCLESSLIYFASGSIVLILYIIKLQSQ